VDKHPKENLWITRISLLEYQVSLTWEHIPHISLFHLYAPPLDKS